MPKLHAVNRNFNLQIYTQFDSVLDPTRIFSTAHVSMSVCHIFTQLRMHNIICNDIDRLSLVFTWWTPSRLCFIFHVRGRNNKKLSRGAVRTIISDSQGNGVMLMIRMRKNNLSFPTTTRPVQGGWASTFAIMRSSIMLHCSLMNSKNNWSTKYFFCKPLLLSVLKGTFQVLEETYRVWSFW